ncbi:hypothetical protein HJG60_011777 [Phyllostomus discolor]|uniref:Uncharacterized protein n=1 Tax=Phyllostomus discolor TaxID=89673 RepID=A0A833ZLH5_9CHIR|nr:hypothetical protein HJG60_011777 [Phyllostomus discolor]
MAGLHPPFTSWARVGSRVQCVGSQAQCVGSRVQCVGSQAQCVGSRVQCVGSRVQCVGSWVQCVGSQVRYVSRRAHQGANRRAPCPHPRAPLPGIRLPARTPGMPGHVHTKMNIVVRLLRSAPPPGVSGGAWCPHAPNRKPGGSARLSTPPDPPAPPLSSPLSPGKEGGVHLPLPVARAPVLVPARGSPGPLTWAPTSGSVRCHGIRPPPPPPPVGLCPFPEPCVVAT